MIQRPQIDLVDDFALLHDRVRALETGAHPRRSSPGGIGRNSEWAKLTPAAGGFYVGGGAAFWRVRSDTVYFRTTGDGVHFTLGRPLFTIGRLGKPAVAQLFSAVGDVEAVLRVAPSGIITPVYGPASGVIKLRQGFSLG